MSIPTAHHSQSSLLLLWLSIVCLTGCTHQIPAIKYNGFLGNTPPEKAVRLNVQGGILPVSLDGRNVEKEPYPISQRWAVGGMELQMKPGRHTLVFREKNPNSEDRFKRWKLEYDFSNTVVYLFGLQLVESVNITPTLIKNTYRAQLHQRARNYPDNKIGGYTHLRDIPFFFTNEWSMPTR
jgi:hypothetical protein